MFWRLRHNIKQYSILVSDGNIYGPQDFLAMTTGSSIDEVKLEFKLDDERPLPTPDFFWTSDAILVARKSVFDLFGPELMKVKTRFYRAKSNIGDLSILAIITEISGFDFDRSTFESFDDGDIEHIEALKLVHDFQTHLDIFRLNDNWGTRFELIVSDKFKKKYEDHNLTGLIFEAAM